MNLYATIGVGLETIVSRELTALGITPRRVEPGRVRFDGDLADLSRALIHLRCVSRVVRELEFTTLEREEDLYDVVAAIDWPRLFSVDATFRVTFNAHSSLVRNSLFATYRVKDAICDRFVRDLGRRPNVDTAAADVSVYCYLENRRLSIGLDGAGDPLHMRGYRAGVHNASLREHLAAAMLLQTGWDASMPLHDPFCGSATILIEAAMLATRTPPTAFRKRFACESWTGFDPDAFAALRREARDAQIAPSLNISGGDADTDAVELARRNIEAAGFGASITLARRDVADMPAITRGAVVTNPPYGERLVSADLAAVWRSFRAAAMRCAGSTVAVLQSNPEFERDFALRPFKKNRMNNGALECVLYQYRIRDAP
jgi:23S rRNA G2445 N2-methylase RlmL